MISNMVVFSGTIINPILYQHGGGGLQLKKESCEMIMLSGGMSHIIFAIQKTYNSNELDSMLYGLKALLNLVKLFGVCGSLDPLPAPFPSISKLLHVCYDVTRVVVFGCVLGLVLMGGH